MKNLILLCGVVLGCSGGVPGEEVGRATEPLTMCPAHQRAVIVSTTERLGGTCGAWVVPNSKLPSWLKLDTYTAYHSSLGTECTWDDAGYCSYFNGQLSIVQSVFHCRMFSGLFYDLDVTFPDIHYGSIHRYGGGCDSTYDVQIRVENY